MIRRDPSKSVRTEITASLIVLGSSATRDEVAKYVSGGPITFWKKGDAVQGSRIIRKEDGWKLGSTLPRDSSLAEHVDKILECVDPVLGTLNRLGGTSIRLSVALYVYGLDRPPLRINAKAVRKLGDMGAEVDIDLYNFP
jgi:hypothetical protein